MMNFYSIKQLVLAAIGFFLFNLTGILSGYQFAGGVIAINSSSLYNNSFVKKK